MSEDNMSAHSMPLMTFHGINALLETNDNQNRNIENNQNDPFVSFKKGLEKASKRIIYENNDLNKKYNVYITSQILSYQKIYGSYRCCKQCEWCKCCLCCSFCFCGCCKKNTASQGDNKRIKDNLKDLEIEVIHKKR